MRDTVPRPRVGLVVATLLFGLLVAGLLLLGGPPSGLGFAGVNEPLQMAMSVFTPLIAILMVHQGKPFVPTLVAALATNSALAGLGVAASANAIRNLGGTSHDVAVIALGSLLVQITATLVGTGFGLLIRRKAVGFLATIVFPLGVWWALGAVDALKPAQEWVTPFAVAGHLLSGEMTATNWAQWLVMVLIWGLALNVLGLKARRGRA